MSIYWLDGRSYFAPNAGLGVRTGRNEGEMMTGREARGGGTVASEGTATYNTASGNDRLATSPVAIFSLFLLFWLGRR